MIVYAVVNRLQNQAYSTIARIISGIFRHPMILSIPPNKGALMRSSLTLALSFTFAFCLYGPDLRIAQGQTAAPLMAGDRMLRTYFAEETARISASNLSNVKTIADWKAARPTATRQLHEMLGLSPMPERTPLQAEITKSFEHDGIVVECIHFQSRPGLYVTANLYRPAKVNKRLPAVLYVCGHGRVKQDGISYGNKVYYHHHGAWFARNGYVCLTIDSLQLGEIEGIHHGTHHYDMWWWLCRGYTPAGVEAWNCIRAVDYLESRDEVDANQIGVTGRSGGGIYSWWVAALDERIAAAVPVAGITDLENHVVDDCVEGHCDCMFFVNTFQWDYPQLAAMVAPRPLLISNTDRDSIFPLDGVVRTFETTHRIYALHDAQKQLALNIAAGTHKDTQELRINAFRWLNYHLRGDDQPITDAATSIFEPQQLKVFDELPEDERNTDVQEWFVPKAVDLRVPLGQTDWKQMKQGWHKVLKERVFASWPESSPSFDTRLIVHQQSDAVEYKVFEFESQSNIPLSLFLFRPPSAETDEVLLKVLNEAEWREFRREQAHLEGTGKPASDSELAQLKQTTVYFAPRGIGPTAWDSDERHHTQIRRRFYLLGQTLDATRVWDIRRAIQLLEALNIPTTQLTVEAQNNLAGVTLYATLYEPTVDRIRLSTLTNSHRNGPYFLNIQRFFDLPQTVAMLADQCEVHLTDANPKDWGYVIETQKVTSSEPVVFGQP